MWQSADNRAARASATDHRDLNGPPKQVGMNGVHSVLPALHKPIERIAALHQKLARELYLAPRQVPPQSQETFWVCCQSRADRSMSEFAFKERLFPAVHRFEAQFSWCPHTALAHPPARVAVPIGCKHQRRVRSWPFILGQGAHRKLGSAYFEHQRGLRKDLPVQRPTVSRIAEEHRSMLLSRPPNEHIWCANENIGRQDFPRYASPKSLCQLLQKVNGQSLTGVEIRWTA